MIKIWFLWPNESLSIIASLSVYYCCCDMLWEKLLIFIAIVTYNNYDVFFVLFFYYFFWKSDHKLKFVFVDESFLKKKKNYGWWFERKWLDIVNLIQESKMSLVYCDGKGGLDLKVLSFLIRYFSNYYTLHRSDLAARDAPLDPRLDEEIFL